jgi:enamine deaminase RidA (YjgF/YER057c/UK114 family)
MSTDLAEQIRVTLENVAKVPEAAGTSLEHVVTVGVFLYVGRRMNPKSYRSASSEGAGTCAHPPILLTPAIL